MEKLIDIRQAAEILGVSVDTLRRWDKNGKLAAIRKEGGTHRYYQKENLETFKIGVLKIALEWVSKNDATKLSSAHYCQTSSIFQSRLVKMENELIKLPGYERLFSLIVLIAGEIGDNSFAHNLGKWPDMPGIFFNYDLQKRVIVLADRGLGVLKTLQSVRPELSNHVAALKVAFTEFISSRKPEKRGNGLKLVKNTAENNPIDLLFMSGDAEVRIQKPEKRFNVTRGTNSICGCLAKIEF